MIAVAKPYPVRSETSAAEENDGARNQRVSMNGSALRRPIEDRDDEADDRDDAQPEPRGRSDRRRSSGIGSLPGEGHREEHRREADRGRGRAGEVEPMLAPRHRPASRRRPGQRERRKPERDVEVEDVAPGRLERLAQVAAGAEPVEQPGRDGSPA